MISSENRQVNLTELSAITDLKRNLPSVIPAQAGIQGLGLCQMPGSLPADAGMTELLCATIR